MNRRPTIKLRESLERRLTAYALAASASGMGLLLWPQPAAARIVYTKADEQLQPNVPLNLDLNHDGVVDFTLDLPVGSSGEFRLSVTGKRTNQVAGYCRNLSQDCWASAQPPHVRIGPNQRFGPYNIMLTGDCFSGSCGGYGPWNDVQNHYLGFEFSVKGKVHYGWARLNVSVDKRQGAIAVLTGYAYETVPNKPIVTGKTKGPNVAALQPAAALGRLAAGAAAISACRGE